MWSLYANKNRGVRIVLDLPGSDFMSTPYAVMGNVQYDPKIKLIDVTHPPLEDLLKNCLIKPKYGRQNDKRKA
mgnify:CR=1 FL=1